MFPSTFVVKAEVAFGASLGTFTAAMSQRPPLPWEGVGFTALALGAMDAPSWLFTPRVPPLPPMPPKPEPAQLPVREPATLRIKRRKLYASIVDGNADDERALQIAKWLELLEMNLECSTIGRNILKAQHEGHLDLIHHIISDALARKATGTLATRASALFLFVRWFQRAAPTGDVPFPPSEAKVYLYFRHLVATNAPASRASSFLQGWNFAVGALGFDDPEGVSRSLRCAGAAHKLLLRKAPTQQKLALTMNMVLALELGSAFCRNPRIRAMAGFACLCIYGRLRVSDAGRITWIEDQSFVSEAGLEEGTLECKALATKTAKTADMKRKFLPVVIPMGSLTGTSWWRNLLESRTALGLEPISVDGSMNGPLLPSSYKAGCPMESAEVSEFLRRYFLALGFGQELVRDVASHSMKACLLSVAAKFGLSLQHRQLLGYHVAKGERSALNYGRDNLGAPVAALQAAIEAVRDGVFVPDAVRGRRSPSLRTPALEAFYETFDHNFTLDTIRELSMESLSIVIHPDGPRATAVAEPPEGGEEPASLEVSDSDSDVGPDRKVAPPEEEDPIGPGVVGEVLANSSQGITAPSSSSAVTLVARHRTRGTCHRLSADPAKACCGERLGSLFELAPLTASSWPLCARAHCFGRGAL